CSSCWWPAAPTRRSPPSWASWSTAPSATCRTCSPGSIRPAARTWCPACSRHVPTPEAGATGAGAGGVLAFLYPALGTERVGMGAWARREASARPVFELMSDVTGMDIARLCDAGPIERLAGGEPAAAAAFATGVAAHLVLESRGVRPAAVAGLSAGELCALWAAGVIDLEDAARLVAARSRLVAECPGSGTGAMGMVEGLAPTAVEQLCSACARNDVLVVAIVAGPRHSGVSGIAAAVDRLLVAAYRAGARRAR